VHPRTVTLPWGLVSRQWDAVDWACVLCDLRIPNDQANRSASSRQCACTFYSSRAGFFWQNITSPRSVSPLQPRFGSLQLTAFPKAKIAFESEEICECDGHTVYRHSERRLTADWLDPRESDCSRVRSKVSSDWLPSYTKATRPVLEIFRMGWHFPDSPRKRPSIVVAYYRNVEQAKCRVEPQNVLEWEEVHRASHGIHSIRVYNIDVSNLISDWLVAHSGTHERTQFLKGEVRSWC
jgi:hypothetical protein